MCEGRIENAVSPIKGVQSASWDVSNHMLTVELTEADFDEDQIHRAVAAVGHDTEKYKASDEAYGKLHLCCKYRDPKMVAIHHNTGELFEFQVDGVCGMCKDRIENAVTAIPEVMVAEWKIESHKLTVYVDAEDFDENQLHQAVAAVGHDTEKIKAKDAVYDKLDGCCKYREQSVIDAHQHTDEEEHEHDEHELGDEHDQEPTTPKQVYGRILVEENGETVPLPGVNIYWRDGKTVVATDEDGRFSLPRTADAQELIASYVGYYSDTIALADQTNIELVLTAGTNLIEVDVVYKRKSIEVSYLEPILTQNISSKELLKAACCTLAESFETNPAVDVAFTDAVTGARQIEMLGLSGPYVQIARENMPDVRGLSAVYGLSYIPGPWIESIQLAKGPGSVVNGFESITGQINVELKKPEEGERLYFNFYGNQGNRWEGNANARFKVGERWHTGLLIHGKWQAGENDQNNDGFLDMPTGTEWTVVNRWKYEGNNGMNSQFGIKVTNFDKISGQQNGPWNAEMQTNRLEGWAKIGKVFENRPAASIGFQVSAALTDQDAFFGSRRYDAEQRSVYANLIYREQLGSTAHTLSSGLSFQYDQYEESLADAYFTREEAVPGAFAEYTYQPKDNFTAVLGLRGDYHNQFGFFLTPRLHFRYAPAEATVLRFSAGQGRRTASILAENIGMLASSRAIILEANNQDTPYGLQQEIAWNVGLNLRQTFVVQNRELVVTLDAYHTQFEQQIVVDYDQNPQEVRFYNLDGRSYSNTFQAQLDYALLDGLDLRMAYRFNDVRTDYQQGTLERPFVSRHRAFVNLGYELDSGWAFDVTVNWQGARRIPSTASNPEAFRARERAPDFMLTNMQISKQWWERFDLYVGVENVFDFRQNDPILSADDPFGTYFDGSLVWGPIFGRMVYAGVRWTWE